MSRKIGELFVELLIKVGLDPLDKQYADAISIQTEMPETVVESFKGLMTLEGAKNNISVKNHYTHAAYNPLDNELHSRMDMFGFSDEQKAIVMAEKSTGKKQQLFLNLVDGEFKKAKSSKDPEDLAKFKKEREETMALLAKKDDDIKALASSKDNELNDYILGAIQDAEFGKHNWSSLYDVNDRGILAKNALNTYLEQNGAKLVLDENKKAKLVKKDNPELEYFDNSNKKITFTELVPRILAEKKYLGVSQPTTQQPFVTTGMPAQSTTKSNTNNTVMNAIAKAKADQGIE